MSPEFLSMLTPRKFAWERPGACPACRIGDWIRGSCDFCGYRKGLVMLADFDPAAGKRKAAA